MKRILAIILSLVLTVCLLSGCNEKADNNSAQIDDVDGAYQGFEAGDGQSNSDKTATDTRSESSSMNESLTTTSKIPVSSTNAGLEQNGSKKENHKSESSKKENSKAESSKKQSSKKENSESESSKKQSLKDQSSKNQSSKKENPKEESSKKENSKQESSKEEILKEESSKVASTNSTTTSSEWELIIPLEKNQLPNYNIDIDNLNEFKQDGRYVKMVDSATLQDYKSYVAKLINSGFKKYDENQIDNSHFISLTDSTTFVSVSFTSGNSKLKVVSEPLGDLYPRKQDNKYTNKGIQSLFTGLKNQNKPIYAGMGFIIRLSDGRFIIIDGGAGDYKHLDSNNMLKVLKEQSPAGTEKPVIAAWIFTHAHDDHIGAFNAFTEDFADKVVIESFYYNFPPVRVIGDKTEGLSHDEYYSYSNFVKCVKKYSDAKIIRPHAGEKYYIGNAIIDMLFTYEDLFPLSLEEGGGLSDFNHTSLIFKINIGGQSMMITGDATNEGMFFLTDNFKNSIQCDILQMSHHGQFGTRRFYSLVNPTYALLPITHVDTNRVTSIDANRWLVSSEKVRQIISFWGGNVTIPLPYNPTDDQIYDRIPTRYTEYYDFLSD